MFKRILPLFIIFSLNAMDSSRPAGYVQRIFPMPLFVDSGEIEDQRNAAFLNAACQGEILELLSLVSSGVSINTESMRNSLPHSVLILAIDHIMNQIVNIRDRRSSQFNRNPQTNSEGISLTEMKKEEEMLTRKATAVVSFFMHREARISIYDFIKSPALMQLFMDKHSAAQIVVSNLLSNLYKQFVKQASINEFAQQTAGHSLSREENAELKLWRNRILKEERTNEVAQQTPELLVSRQEDVALKLWLNQTAMIQLLWGKDALLWQLLQSPIDKQLPQIFLFFRKLGMDYRLADPNGRTLLWHLVYQAFNPSNYNRVPLIEACSDLIEVLVQNLKVSVEITDHEGISIKKMLENSGIDPKTDKHLRVRIVDVHGKIKEVIRRVKTNS